MIKVQQQRGGKDVDATMLLAIAAVITALATLAKAITPLVKLFIKKRK